MTVSCAGLTGAIGQILILRELLVLFYGNELSSGLFFSCWLVWTAVGCGAAGVWLRIKKLPPATPSPMLILSRLALPSVLLFIRASRLLWSLPMGEMVSLPLMAAISFLATFPLCVTLGALFSVAWSSYASLAACDGHGGPIRVYICEALGAAVGGVVFYFLLLPNVHPFRIALAVSGILIAAAGVIIFLSILAGRRSAGMAASWCVAVSLAARSRPEHEQSRCRKPEVAVGRSNRDGSGHPVSQPCPARRSGVLFALRERVVVLFRPRPPIR